MSKGLMPDRRKEHVNNFHDIQDINAFWVPMVGAFVHDRQKQRNWRGRPICYLRQHKRLQEKFAAQAILQLLRLTPLLRSSGDLPAQYTGRHESGTIALIVWFWLRVALAANLASMDGSNEKILLSCQVYSSLLDGLPIFAKFSRCFVVATSHHQPSGPEYCCATNAPSVYR